MPANGEAAVVQPVDSIARPVEEYVALIRELQQMPVGSLRGAVYQALKRREQGDLFASAAPAAQ